MNLPIIARFKSSGSPQTGLTPTVTVRQVNQNDGSSTTVVNAQTMTEIEDGLYLYNFAGFNIRYNYIATFDAGTTSDQRYLEAEYSGVQALLDAIPRGGGGSAQVGITKAQLDEIAKELKDYTNEVLSNLTLEVDQTDIKEQKKELDKAIKEFKKAAKAEQKELLSLIDKKLKEVSKPEVNITTETVDTRRFESQMTQSISKQLKIEQEALDELLADAVLLLRKEIKQNNEKYRDIIRAEVESEVIAEFKAKLRS